ncbi:MAG: acyl-CoA dehydratase activase [Desulfobacterales bacterium]
MIAAGCDVGSLSAEAVILEDDEIKAAEIIRVRPRAEQSAREVMDLALSKLKLSYEDIDYIVSTGYGRETIPFSDHNISEISCHGKGAFFLAPGIRTVIDIGGQDCKAIRVDEYGGLEDFVMNDKCAAGTGRSLELMSQYLGVDFSELSGLARQAEQPLTITSQCSIFSELEIMHYLMEDKNPADIAAGICESMARRVKMLAGRVGVKPEITITGGVCKNAAVVSYLEHMLDIEFVPLTEDPQIIGALGAAVFAGERCRRLKKKARTA